MTQRMPFLSISLFLFMLISCQKDDKRREEQLRDAKAKELIFNNINKNWNFTTPVLLSAGTENLVTSWTELRVFLTEINEKPKSSIGAFQKKAKELSKKAEALNNNIPPQFNKPEIKARIAVLRTKINSINLFINLDDIPDQKVVANIVDANEELGALYRQMDEIVRKSLIPKAEGENDMIKMLDTARAIPNAPKPPAAHLSPMEQLKRKQLH